MPSRRRKESDRRKGETKKARTVAKTGRGRGPRELKSSYKSWSQPRPIKSRARTPPPGEHARRRRAGRLDLAAARQPHRRLGSLPSPPPSRPSIYRGRRDGQKGTGQLHGARRQEPWSSGLDSGRARQALPRQRSAGRHRLAHHKPEQFLPLGSRRILTGTAKAVATRDATRRPIGWYNDLTAQGFHSLLTASNGQGGYHSPVSAGRTRADVGRLRVPQAARQRP